MAGSLCHSCNFRKDFYVGGDGREHYELIAIDGDLDVVAWSTWREFKQYCESHGIRSEMWPEYETEIDIPIEDAIEKCSQLRETIIGLPMPVVSGNKILGYIRKYMHNGEIVFYVF